MDMTTLIRIWPIEEIAPLADAYPECKGLGNCPPNCFLFADWSIWGMAYGIVLSGDAFGRARVLIVDTEPPIEVAGSWTEFLDGCLRDTPQLYGNLLWTIPDAIEKRIAQWLEEDDRRYDRVRDAVRRFHFLPLYHRWTAVLGIRPDRSFVRWDYEDNREKVKPLEESYLQRLAVCEGAKRYPELRALIPPRPPEAIDCVACKGTGKVHKLPDVICECCGLGWLIPGEDRGPATG